MLLFLQAQVRHRNFIEAIRSLVQVGTFSERDVVVQMARCSFDIHVGDILGTLIVGGTLVMLRPEGNLDFDYLSRVLVRSHVTYMHAVPTLLYSFFMYLNTNDLLHAVQSLRSLCSSGKKTMHFCDTRLTFVCRRDSSGEAGGFDQTLRINTMLLLECVWSC